MNFKLEDAEDRSLIAVRTKVKRDAARQTLKAVSYTHLTLPTN